MFLPWVCARARSAKPSTPYSRKSKIRIRIQRGVNGHLSPLKSEALNAAWAEQHRRLCHLPARPRLESRFDPVNRVRLPRPLPPISLGSSNRTERGKTRNHSRAVRPCSAASEHGWIGPFQPSGFRSLFHVSREYGAGGAPPGCRPVPRSGSPAGYATR